MTGWLEGYVALITGGGSGLGRAVAERYLAEGARVVIVGHAEAQLIETVEAQRQPDRISSYVADVRDTDSLHAAVEHAVERFGKLDVVVPNAGIWDYQQEVARLSGEELGKLFDELFSVNVKGYLLTAQATWSELVKTRGSIVMTLSNASFYPAGGGAVYTAAKHACLGLVRELAYEFAPSVRVNGVAPGGMRTDLRGPAISGMQDRSMATFFPEEAGPNPVIPLHDSPVAPEAFTAPYVLLAAREQSSTITGAVIPADGGIGVRGLITPAGGDHLAALAVGEGQ